MRGCWSNSTTPALHAGDRGATPRRSTDDRRAHGPTGRRRLREAEIRVRLPAGPLRALEAWGHGPTGGHRPGVAEVRVRLPVTPLRFVGRQANWRATPLLAGRPRRGCGFESHAFRCIVPVVKRRSRLGPNETFRVRLLVGTLAAPMVKRRSSLASNEGFRVRILVGVLRAVSSAGQSAGVTCRRPQVRALPRPLSEHEEGLPESVTGPAWKAGER